MTRSTDFIWGIAALVLTLALTITGGIAKAIEQSAALDDDQRFTRLTAPIDDLDAHLAQLRAGGDSPLLALTSEARKRLIDSVRFGSYGVLGFRIGDVRAQLEPLQIYVVASLFGLQAGYAGILFPADLLSEEDKDLRAMLECTGKYAQAKSSL